MQSKLRNSAETAANWRLRAADWDGLVDFAEMILAPGTGKALSSEPPLFHPWKIESRWDAGHGVWTFRVWPGYVRGHRVAVKQVPEWSLGERALRRLELTIPANQNSDTPYDTDLCEEPWIPVSRFAWRVIAGPDGAASLGEDDKAKVVPQVLYEVWNVEIPKEVTIDYTSTGLVASGLSPEEEAQDRAITRQARCAEVALFQPRPVAELVSSDVSVMLGGLAPQTLQIAWKDPGAHPPYLVIQQEQPVDATSRESEITAISEDGGENEDVLAIATIWLVGPEGDHSGEPDGSWTPLVQYFCHWNLDWTVDARTEEVAPQAIENPLDGLIGGGAAQGIIDSINVDNAQEAALTQRAIIKSCFWNA